MEIMIAQDQELEIARKALEQSQRLYGENSPQAADRLKIVSDLLRKQGLGLEAESCDTAIAGIQAAPQILDTPQLNYRAEESELTDESDSPLAVAIETVTDMFDSDTVQDLCEMGTESVGDMLEAGSELVQGVCESGSEATQAVCEAGAGVIVGLFQLLLSFFGGDNS